MHKGQRDREVSDIGQTEHLESKASITAKQSHLATLQPFADGISRTLKPNHQNHRHRASDVGQLDHPEAEDAIPIKRSHPAEPPSSANVFSLHGEMLSSTFDPAASVRPSLVGLPIDIVVHGFKASSSEPTASSSSSPAPKGSKPDQPSLHTPSNVDTGHQAASVNLSYVGRKRLTRVSMESLDSNLDSEELYTSTPRRRARSITPGVQIKTSGNKEAGMESETSGRKDQEKK